ncbi:hypothetical protein L6164_030923 [Bauhinia variegata]|uniref:Uncharacterized protein n=1 Tax=Bauhinia variegata TaxID=167791 RepID=A0ACB9LDE0_BAUVA|nr:hypothetical protein L6164_030923 [Bauhinia variegata]
MVERNRHERREKFRTRQLRQAGNCCLISSSTPESDTQIHNPPLTLPITLLSIPSTGALLHGTLYKLGTTHTKTHAHTISLLLTRKIFSRSSNGDTPRALYIPFNLLLSHFVFFSHSLQPSPSLSLQ